MFASKFFLHCTFGYLILLFSISLSQIARFHNLYTFLQHFFSVVAPINCRFFLWRFPLCFNLFVLLFLVTPCLVVAVQPCMEWIPIKKKKGGMKLIFCMQIYKPFCKLILSILVSMASLAQSTRNNKFAKSLQYLEKEVRDKVDFCRDKFQSIQKVGTVISDGCNQACLKYSK